MSSQLVISRGIDQKWKPFHREMRKLFASLLIAGSAYANEISVRSLQSGSQYGGTPIHDHGIHGEDQIIAVLDTGLDINSCYFVEADGSAPPINTGTPSGGYQWEHVNASRRKVIAYDFLYSCDQFPNAIGCDNPAIADDYDNQGHGTHAAASAAGDRLPAIVHDYADSIAPGAKLVIQDAGFIGGDNCSQRPGIGCPVNLTPILDQAYKQGARIHSNSWGDRQGVAAPATPPTANYSQSARDVDAFVYAHPDMLVVFNTGNSSSRLPAPASSLSAPGCAKNTLQVGGTRTGSRADDIISSFTLVGPTRDGRIKPDVVGPAYVTAGDAKVITGNECGTTQQPGTSWSSPTIAGAAALVRQYYTDGFYPTGVATPSNRFTPSAALMKATIIAAAHRVALKSGPTNDAVRRTRLGVSCPRRRALLSRRSREVARRRRSVHRRTLAKRVVDDSHQRSRRHSLESSVGLDRSRRRSASGERFNAGAGERSRSARHHSHKRHPPRQRTRRSPQQR